MAWVIGILKFIFAVVGMLSMLFLFLNCLQAIVTPQLATEEDGEIHETGANFRYILAIITSVAWAIVICLP